MPFCNSINHAKEVLKELDKKYQTSGYIISNCCLISIVNIVKCPYKKALEVFLHWGIFERAKDLTRSKKRRHKEYIKNGVKKIRIKKTNLEKKYNLN